MSRSCQKPASGAAAAFFYSTPSQHSYPPLTPLFGSPPCAFLSVSLLCRQTSSTPEETERLELLKISDLTTRILLTVGSCLHSSFFPFYLDRPVYDPSSTHASTAYLPVHLFRFYGSYRPPSSRKNHSISGPEANSVLRSEASRRCKSFSLQNLARPLAA